jgi:hypothetical protein
MVTLHPMHSYGGAAHNAGLEERYGWREPMENSRSPWQRDISWTPAIPRAPVRIKHFVKACVYSDPMEGKLEGLTEKLYWRKAKGEWHCFKRLPEVRGYISLCQRREIALVLGQQIARPQAPLRCEVCDGLEMVRRGWDGSGPASPRRAGGLSR